MKCFVVCRITQVFGFGMRHVLPIAQLVGAARVDADQVPERSGKGAGE
jgi:hypothetical protein